MALQFYKCPHCGNLIVKVIDGGVTPVCCGQPMEKLVPQEAETIREKHLPVVEKTGDNTYKVLVGELPHVMTEAHHIDFICIETETTFQICNLAGKEKAEAVFTCAEKPVAVYEHCNLHGLWKTNV